MESLFKYLTLEFAESFVNRGKIRFRSLSYFRDYEDSQIRGDEFEGTRRYAPSQGLTINVVGESGPRIVPCAFESTAHESDIFVLCLSTENSTFLARKFNATACVEIFDPVGFINKVRAAIPPRYKIVPKQLVHGLVNYYAETDPPIVDWALPERIAMSKPQIFSWQQEYRLTFAIKDGFKVENVSPRLVSVDADRRLPSAEHASYDIALGYLGKMCRIREMS